MQKVRYISNYQSPLGNIVIISDSINIISVYFGEFIELDSIRRYENLSVFINTKKWLDKYFAKQNPNIFTLPFLLQGSDFRKLVLHYLCKIPYGEVTTYGYIANDVARILNKQKLSPQAIGNAISHNPIAIIIPCHRVIGSKNTIKGYNAGIDIKYKLLEVEGFDISILK